jgi:hypothetical protein
MAIIRKGLKSYEIGLWPNNQPPVLLGYLLAKSKKAAIAQARKDFSLQDRDPISAMLSTQHTPLKRYRKQARFL